MMENEIGILLTNIGSPDALTVSAVKSYLAKFLSDKRVVELPALLWRPILHGYVLRTRPKKSLALYKKIWTNQGSPLTVISQQLADLLRSELNIPVAVGMHYGKPTIETALSYLKEQNVKKIIIIPLYPQYSGTTTATTFDQVTHVLKKWRYVPEIVYINNYHAHEHYITAVANSIQHQPLKHLLFSFHGIPQQCITKGDPYAKQCHTTARLIAEKLNLSDQQWTLSFQSRLGRAQWLEPYTDKILIELPRRGITDIHVACPGFAIDCLETLEEIAIRGKEQFMKAGGNSFNYIPSLNDSIQQRSLLKSIIENHINLAKNNYNHKF